MNTTKPNDQQKVFIREAARNVNKTQASIAAGYSPKSAANTGNRLYKQFIKLIEIERALIAEEVGIDDDYVLRRLKEIDDLDIIDILDDDGNVLPIPEWPKIWRTSISGVEVSTIGGGGDSASEIVKKIKWPDKTKNLDMIGKHTKVSAWTGPGNKEDTAKSSDGPQIYIVELPSNGR